MVRLVNREYLVDLVEQYYKEQERNCSFCGNSNCIFCKTSKILEEELIKKKNINIFNSDVVTWKISHYKNDPSILTFFSRTLK